MKLTANEKKVLNMLLENAKITDSAISSKLKISSQAVGKIRRKLEELVIDSYTINLNYSRMGIHAFAITLSKLTPDGLDKGELQIEKQLQDIPHIIQVHRLPHSSYTHVIFYGFRDLEELDNFFHSSKMSTELFKFIETKELFAFSHNSLIKNDPAGLFKEIITGISSPKKKGIPEIESFKRRLSE